MNNAAPDESTPGDEATGDATQGSANDATANAETAQASTSEAQASDIDSVMFEQGEAESGAGTELTELQEAEQRYLRSQAELDNYRKRAQRMMDEERKYAAIPFIRDMLPIVDNLSGAVSAAEGDESSSGITQGVQMVCEQLESMLAQHKCQKIDPLGDVFDPNLHEAIQMQASDQPSTGRISMVVQVGYQLHERVIRPAQVFVSTGPAAG